MFFSRHDVWIPASRALAPTAANRKRQHELNAVAEKQKRKYTIKSPSQIVETTRPKRKSLPTIKKQELEIAALADTTKTKRKSVPAATPTTPIKTIKKRKSSLISENGQNQDIVAVGQPRRRSRRSTTLKSEDKCPVTEPENDQATPVIETAAKDPVFTQPKPPARHSIKIPDGLKELMVYDWDCVNRKHRLHELPAKTTVQDILNAYNAAKQEDEDNATDGEVAYDVDSPAGEVVHFTQKAVLDSLIEYFDALLGRQMLYRNERPQHRQVRLAYQDVPMSRLYGPYHLLRLFELLNKNLSQWAELAEAVQHIERFLVYLDHHKDLFLSKQCWVTTTERS